MGGDPTNPYPIGVNISVGATMYSTLAGIMAGFAFTAIVLLVVTWLDESKRAQRVLAATGRALVASFFGLLIMSVLYAAESAGAYSWGLSISENVVLAAGFSGVSILLIYAIVLILETADETTDPPSTHGQDPARFSRAFACILNLLILGVAYDSVSDYESARYGLSHSTTGIDVLAWSLLGIQGAVTLGSALMFITRPTTGGRLEQHRATTSTYLLYAGLGLPVASAVGYVAIDTKLAETGLVSPTVVTLVLTAVFTLTCTTTLQLTLTRPPRTIPPPTSTSTAPTPPPPTTASPIDATPAADPATLGSDEPLGDPPDRSPSAASA